MARGDKALGGPSILPLGRNPFSRRSGYAGRRRTIRNGVAGDEALARKRSKAKRSPSLLPSSEKAQRPDKGAQRKRMSSAAAGRGSGGDDEVRGIHDHASPAAANAAPCASVARASAAPRSVTFSHAVKAFGGHYGPWSRRWPSSGRAANRKRFRSSNKIRRGLLRRPRHAITDLRAGRITPTSRWRSALTSRLRSGRSRSASRAAGPGSTNWRAPGRPPEQQAKVAERASSAGDRLYQHPDHDIAEWLTSTTGAE